MGGDTSKNDVGRGRTVAVVEDNERNARLVEDVLTAHGFQVGWFADGRTALDGVGALRPDVLLIDIQLPDLDGVEVLRLLRQECSLTAPAIAVTAYAMDGDRERFLAAGFDHYLAKPIDVRSLAATVGRMIPRES